MIVKVDNNKVAKLKEMTGCKSVRKILNEALTVYMYLFHNVRQGYRVMLVPEDEGKEAVEIKFSKEGVNG